MKKTLIIFIPLFILICISASIFFKKVNKKTKEQNEDILVKTCRPEFENIYTDIETFGTVVYKTKTEVTNLVPGNVVAKYIKEGDFVSKGDILYKLQNVELEIEHTQNQNNVNSCKANLELYEAKLSEREKEIKAKLISILNLEAEIQISENNLKLSNENLQKKINLHKLGGITKQELKESQNQFNNLTAELEIQKRELTMNNMGFTKEDLISAGITPSENQETFIKQVIELNTKTARADLEVAKSEYENSMSNLELTKKLLDNLLIKAPSNGIIGSINFENGEYIKQNENVLTIIDISTCVAALNIQENNIYNISVGNRAKIEIPAANKTIDTFITEISPVADSTTGNFFVKADFKNNQNLIKPGMYLKCSISNNYHTKYLKIPETALFNTTEKNADCFIVKNQMAFLQKVQIAFIKNGYAFINSGLTDEYQIINNPPKTIKDGSYVKIL